MESAWPNLFKYRMHGLKPLVWDTSGGLDGVFLKSTASDVIDIMRTGCELQVDYGVEQSLKDNKVYATIKTLGNKEITKEFDTFKAGLFWCERRREVFWNEIYYNIQTNIFDNSKGDEEL